jgi:hypothetical protein
MENRPMDLEARAHSEHPEELRLWLRLLTCTQLVEKQVRAALREQFDTTLPRFDLMAQLERAPDGLRMNELSRRMMVTWGQCHRHHRPARRRGPGGTHRRGRRPARLARAPHTQGAGGLRRHGTRPRGMDRRVLCGLDGREITQLHRLLGKVKSRFQEEP